MSISKKVKGGGGEREICSFANEVYLEVLSELNQPPCDTMDLPFQRNQNQSAVGGSDITNPFNLEIEVKRQEALSVNTWWTQTLNSADRTGGIPILIYRQNRKKWNVVMYTLTMEGDIFVKVRSTFSLEDFKVWLKDYMLVKLGDT